MAVIINQDAEDVEWVDDEFLDVTGLNLPLESANDTPLPVIEIEAAMRPVWSE